MGRSNIWRESCLPCGGGWGPRPEARWKKGARPEAASCITKKGANARRRHPVFENKKKQLQTLNRRAFFLLLGKVSLFSIVGWRLFDIQILDSEKYKTLSKNNQITYDQVESLSLNELLKINIWRYTKNRIYICAMIS